jgi:hypothetical protein
MLKATATIATLLFSFCVVSPVAHSTPIQAGATTPPAEPPCNVGDERACTMPGGGGGIQTCVEGAGRTGPEWTKCGLIDTPGA